ncbi:MAG: RluA family pseudouridine synthase [Candidatus Saccharimonadales bacterium]
MTSTKQSTHDTSLRLDQYVVNALGGVSRALASSLVKQGKVKLNGQVQKKAGLKINKSDTIEIAATKQPGPIKPLSLKVIYEDDDCVVAIKPTGVLTHSKGEYNPEATVASWLSDKVSDIAGNRAGIVHRLDRATSGVIICAKNPHSLSFLQKQFSSRKVKKQYFALVEGEVDPAEAIIDMPIERNPKKPQTFRTGPNGKRALTRYEVVSYNDARTLLLLRPQTGRTHQLRVHLQAIGHPIVGDTLYGGAKADRLYLHAASLELTLPNGQRKIFEDPLPKGFSIKG